MAFTASNMAACTMAKSTAPARPPLVTTAWVVISDQSVTMSAAAMPGSTSSIDQHQYTNPGRFFLVLMTFSSGVGRTWMSGSRENLRVSGGLNEGTGKNRGIFAEGK